MTPPWYEGCMVQGCERPHVARGYCEQHYRRWRKHGDPSVVVVRGPQPIIDRILERVALDESGCWLWLGARTGGYGNIMVGSRRDGSRRFARVHRLVYEHFVGTIPDGLVLDHLCRVTHCCNPWHLEPVTHRENTLRGEAPSVRAYRDGRCSRGHAYSRYARVDAKGHHHCRICLNEGQRARRAAA